MLIPKQVLGFTFDGVWDMPGIGRQWQFTNRSMSVDDSFAGATFYVPVGTPHRKIVRRAKEVRSNFSPKKQDAKLRVMAALASCDLWKVYAHKMAAKILRRATARGV